MPSSAISELRDQIDRALVTVDPHRAPVLTLRQLRDLVEHRAARALADVLAEHVQIVEVELRHHLDQTRAAHVVARRQRVHVAFGLDRLARVGPDHRHQGLVEHAAVGELEHRNVDAFHVHVGRVGAEADAADVGEVRRAREQPHDLAAMEAGGGQHEVVEVPGAHPRIVGDVDVPLVHRVDGEVAQEVVDRLRHGVHVAGGAGHGLSEHPSAGVEHAGGEIARLAHDGRERGAQERLRLLLDDRDQAVPHDLHADGLQCIGAHRSSP